MLESTANYFESSLMFHGSLSVVMGTRFDIVLIGAEEKKSRQIWGKISEELKRLDKMLNRFDGQSEIATINASAFSSEVYVSDEFWKILMDCKRYNKVTLGLFDITLKDFSRIIFHENSQSISFSTAETSLDLGGYAKGYAMEKVKAILKTMSIEHAFVDFGKSSVLALGHHPYGDHWAVSVENPNKQGEILAEIKLKDKALSTSGNMPTHTKHIINPLTGTYSEERKIVCVVTENSIDAEVLTTSLMVANSVEKEEIISQFNIEKTLIFSI